MVMMSSKWRTLLDTDAVTQLKRKSRAANKPGLGKSWMRLDAPQQHQRLGFYRFKVQHLNVSSLTSPRQAANASVTGSRERICCASAIMKGIV